RWGDVWAGLYLALARFALVKLRRHAEAPRNWRPHILVFAGDASKRIGLVRLASWFNQNRGIVTVCRLIEADLAGESIDIPAETAEMNRAIEREGLLAFGEVNVVADFEAGVVDVAQANGIAGLHSNTVMFGWSSQPRRRESHLRMVRGLAKAGKSTLITRLDWRHEPGRERRIDLWWGGLEHNGDMMLLLAYLLSLNAEWADSRILIRTVARSEEERAMQEQGLEQLVPQTRIPADAEVLTLPPGETLSRLIRSRSESAAIVFFGMKEPEAGGEAAYAANMRQLVEGLATVVFVHNAGRFAGRLI
ncbi:MAG: hypothetical protein R3244_13390, partial [Thermoanaerobaculia bacterium]|nr:hypothetical protein [Thermoanaerobaculia bacterium]